MIGNRLFTHLRTRVALLPSLKRQYSLLTTTHPNNTLNINNRFNSNHKVVVMVLLSNNKLLNNKEDLLILNNKEVLLSNNNNNNHYNSTVIRCFSSSQFSLRYSFINKEDIQQLLKDKVPDQDFVLIDVRENEEFTSADLPAIHTSAHNIPLNDLGPALLTMDAKQFKYVYGFDKPMVDAHSELATSGYGASRNVSEKPKSVLSGSDSNSALSSKKIIVYCKMGGRAEKAAQLLNDLGFENVFCYKGSASEWWNKK